MRSIQEILTDAFRQYSERTGIKADTVRSQATVIDLAPATISRIMNGKCALSQQLAQRIAEKLFSDDGDRRRFVQEIKDADNPLDPEENLISFLRYYAKPSNTVLIEVYAQWPIGHLEKYIRAMRGCLEAGSNLCFFLPRAMTLQTNTEFLELLDGRYGFSREWGMYLGDSEGRAGSRLAFYANRHISAASEHGFVFTGHAVDKGTRSFVWFERQNAEWEWLSLRRKEHFLLELLLDSGEKERLPPTNEEIDRAWTKRLRYRGLDDSYPAPIVRMD